MKTKLLLPLFVILFIVSQFIRSQSKGQPREFYQLTVYLYNTIDVFHSGITFLCPADYSDF